MRGRRSLIPPRVYGFASPKLSDYGLQLQEKQKVRFTYCMSEKQFKRFFVNAAKFKGSHGE
ncbi:MAG: 30S ribosomal protein S4, partial [Sweet potato little leaf phytoplasma]|nr:30S ribosomal protein S4 [Sweet potato little leaf phytoplasma]